jgi:phosphatidylserine/phosphatidylglycerophosphate/cardiolipin synthase-like enzyme
METSSKNTLIKLGRGKGIEILNTIKNAKTSVKIVSPYLSPDYTKELIHLHNKGVQVTLITCDSLETNNWSDFKPSDIIKKQEIINPEANEINSKIPWLALIFFSIFIVSLPLAVFSFYIPIALLLITIIIFLSKYIMDDYKHISDYTPIFRLKVFDSKSGINPQSTNLIHSKIFLIDEKILYLGSANFTYSAFKTHYETIIKVQDEEAINDVSQEIEVLFNSKELKEKSWDSLVG